MKNNKISYHKKDNYMVLSILNHKVYVKEVKMDKIHTPWFCAYVEFDLEKSKYLSDKFLNHPTYREREDKKEVFGVDTCHAYNEGQDKASKLADALNQIEGIIIKFEDATNDNFYKEEVKGDE